MTLKDHADTLTHELPLPRRRGRPSTGEAMTPAQRKRAQRSRDRAASMADDWTSCTTERLLRELGSCVSYGLCLTAQAVASELQARAQSVYDLKLEKARQDREAVTVTQNSVVHLPMPEPVTVTENAGDDLDGCVEPAPAPVKRAKPAPKYRYAATGETWSGRGKAPKWVQVFVARGGLLDDLLL